MLSSKITESRDGKVINYGDPYARSDYSTSQRYPAEKMFTNKRIS